MEKGQLKGNTPVAQTLVPPRHRGERRRRLAEAADSELGHGMIVWPENIDASETTGRSGGAVRRGTLRGQMFVAPPKQITKLQGNAVLDALFPTDAVLAGVEERLAKSRNDGNDEGDKMDGALCVPSKA